MPAVAGVSPGEATVGLGLTLVGILLQELVKWIVVLLQGRKSPLGRFYWLVSYAPDDVNWAVPTSIELVRFCRRGRRVKGRMYRIYKDHHQRRWSLEGRLRDGEPQLGLMYTSIGEDFGSNGTMTLGLLNRWLWSGVFQEAPNPEERAELVHVAARSGAIGRIGADIPAEAHAELIAVDQEIGDCVLGFLAPLSFDSLCLPRRVARRLPRSARRVLLQRRRDMRLYDRIEPRAWSSPSRRIFLGEDAAEESEPRSKGRHCPAPAA